MRKTLSAILCIAAFCLFSICAHSQDVAYSSSGGAAIGGNLQASKYDNICAADEQAGSDMGAKINACIASQTEVRINTSGSISTPIVIKNVANIWLHCMGNNTVQLTDGITGNPANPMILIEGKTTQFIRISGCNLVGNSATGAGGNGHAIALIGAGNNPTAVHIDHNSICNFKGTGSLGGGGTVGAAGVYVYQSLDVHIEHDYLCSNQYGALVDTGGFNGWMTNSNVVNNAKSGFRTQGSAEKWHVLYNDIEGNGMLTTDRWLDFENCEYQCVIAYNWFEGNNGLMFFGTNGNPGNYEYRGNVLFHSGANASASFMADSGAAANLLVESNEFYGNTNLSLSRVFDINPGAGKKIFRNNGFDLTSPATVTDGIGWGTGGTQSGACDFSYNTFGTDVRAYFAGTNAISTGGAGITVKGCHIEGNACFTNSGTLTNCVAVGSGATNTYVLNTLKGGAGTISNTVNDAGTSTTCQGQGCPLPTLFTNFIKPQSGSSLTLMGNSGAVLFGPSGNASISDSTGLFNRLGGVVLSAQGTSNIYGAISQKSEKSGDSNLLTMTPPAATGTYRLRFVLSLSAADAATVGWTARWKDSSGNAQAPANLALFQSGTAAPALTFTTSAAGDYYGDATIDIDNSATNIVVQLTFSGTSFRGKASATVERLQ